MAQPRKMIVPEHMSSLELLTNQLEATGKGLDYRFRCLSYMTPAIERCRVPTHYFTALRTGMMARTWAALKQETISEKGFIDIARSMFCGYHDTIARFSRYHGCLRELWKHADDEAQAAFRAAIVKGFHDTFDFYEKKTNVKRETIEESLNSQVEDYEGATSNSQLMVLYKPEHEYALRTVREHLESKNILPKELLEAYKNASDESEYGDADPSGSLQPNYPKIPQLQSSDDSKMMGDEWLNGCSPKIMKTESTDISEDIFHFRSDSVPSNTDYYGNKICPDTPPSRRVGSPGEVKDSSPSPRVFKEFRRRLPYTRDTTKDQVIDGDQRQWTRTPELQRNPFEYTSTGAASANLSVNENHLPVRPKSSGGIPQSQQYGFLSPSTDAHSFSFKSTDSSPDAPTSSEQTNASPRTTPIRPRSRREDCQFEKLPLWRIADKIHDILLATIQEEKGYMYVLKAPRFFETFPPAKKEGEKWIKIGMSRDVGKRIQSLKAKCGFDELEECGGSSGQPLGPLPMMYLRRIEKVCHTELRNFRRTMDCRKGTGRCEVAHSEWFAVSEEVAIRTVERWILFFSQDPYDDYGYLNDFWRESVRHGEYRKIKEGDNTHLVYQSWLDSSIKRQQQPRSSFASPTPGYY